jgi:hypothetical protein
MPKCLKCKTEAEQGEKFCSNCGSKLVLTDSEVIEEVKKSKTAPIIFGILVLVLIFWGFQSISTCSSSVPSSAPPTTASIQNPQSEKLPHNLNETVSVGHFYYAIGEGKPRKSIGDLQTSGYFLILSVVFQNHDNETRTLDNSLFTLYDSEGKEYNVSTEAITQLEMSGIPTIFLKDCSPGVTKSGSIAFEIPKKGIYKLKLSGGFTDNSYEYVSIPVN